jgi:CxxH/CxxC protein (TIGR04129 family)
MKEMPVKTRSESCEEHMGAALKDFLEQAGMTRCIIEKLPEGTKDRCLYCPKKAEFVMRVEPERTFQRT